MKQLPRTTGDQSYCRTFVQRIGVYCYSSTDVNHPAVNQGNFLGCRIIISFSYGMQNVFFIRRWLTLNQNENTLHTAHT